MRLVWLLTHYFCYFRTVGWCCRFRGVVCVRHTEGPGWTVYTHLCQQLWQTYRISWTYDHCKFPISLLLSLGVDKINWIILSVCDLFLLILLNRFLLWIKTYYNYLNIDCWCLIKCVLQTRLLGILSFFYQRKGWFYSWDLLSSSTDELILMKLYTAVVYNLRMCMIEENPGINISREIIQGR